MNSLIVNNSIDKKCLWCLKSSPEVKFDKKAHTIPKSLGGEKLNPNVCDDCNYYFGNRECNNGKYSIEEALKETFNIPRKWLLTGMKPKRKVGDFKSKFFEIKSRNGKYRIVVKQSFKFTSNFQKEICHSFKRGFFKMIFEEFNRQKKIGYEPKFNVIRDFARYNKGNLPILFFRRKHGALLSVPRWAESPNINFNEREHLINNISFVEVEFFGLLFGLPICEFKDIEFEKYTLESMAEKESLFSGFTIVERLTDIDFTLSIMRA